MAISLFVKAQDVSKIALHHPATKEKVGAFLIAGPDHEATKAWRREINDRRQKPGFKEDVEAEIREGLIRRTAGWEGVKDTETGEDVPFDAAKLPEVYAQDWLYSQVLIAIGEEGFFYKE